MITNTHFKNTSLISVYDCSTCEREKFFQITRFPLGYILPNTSLAKCVYSVGWIYIQND